jgi:hypothetical protein
MKFDEIFPYLIGGKKIRATVWEPNQFITNEDSIVMNECFSLDWEFFNEEREDGKVILLQHELKNIIESLASLYEKLNIFNPIKKLCSFCDGKGHHTMLFKNSKVKGNLVVCTVCKGSGLA